MTSDSVNAATLTSTKPVDWQTLPMTDVLKISGDGTLHSKEFQNLYNCKQRMLGRALAQIEGPITLQIYSPPNSAVVMAVGAIPQTAGSTSAPANVAQVLACGGVVLRANPTTGSEEKVLRLSPGITTALKGASTTVLVGGPPHIYAFANCIDLKTGTVSDQDCYLIFSYSLSLHGYDWIKPF